MGSNGCDSVVTLLLTVLPKSSSTTTANFCTGGTYIWNGNTYSTAGTYSISLPNSVGCDSTATLILQEIQPQFDTVYSSICPQGSYDFDGNTLVNPGTYVANLKNTLGCDSIVTLILSPKLGDTSYFSANTCEGSEYILDGNIYKEGGEYELFYRSSTGCDSVVYFTLTVLPASNALIQASICSGSVYVFQGVSYSTTGTYTATMPAQNGCDSVVTLELTVNDPSSDTVFVTQCAGSSTVWGNRTFTQPGFYTDTLTNNFGCDSVVTLDFQWFAPSLKDTVVARICTGNSYAFGGNTYSQPGFYSTTLVNANGCDSVVVLDLQVNFPVTTALSASICAGST